MLSCWFFVYSCILSIYIQFCCTKISAFAFLVTGLIDMLFLIFHRIELNPYLLCVQLLFAQAICFRLLLIMMSGEWCSICNCEVRTENHWTSKRHKKALCWTVPKDLSYLKGKKKFPCFPAKVEECLDAPPPCAGCGRTFDCDGLCTASWRRSKEAWACFIDDLNIRVIL